VITEQEIKRALKVVLADKSINNYTTSWASDYCKEALKLSGEVLRAKMPDIVRVTKGWRSVDSVEVRGLFKQYFKEGKGDRKLSRKETIRGTVPGR